MTRVGCVLARPGIILAAAEGGPLDGPLRRHRDRCLPCQAAEARTVAGLRTLRAAPPGPAVPPADLEQRIVDALGRRRRRVPLVPLAAASVAAGIAAGVVRFRRLPAAP